MIKKWRSRLAEMGFELIIPNKKEVIFERNEGHFTMTIFEDKMKGDSKKKRLNLFLFMKDRFSSKGEMARVIIIHGFLGKDRVDLLNERFGDWWMEEDEHIAFAALQSHGIPWFSQYCNVWNLINLWENYRHPHAKSQPPIRHLYLSLLYDVAGDRENACLNGRKWLEFKLKLPPEGDEPERTKRQLEIMGC